MSGVHFGMRSPSQFFKRREEGAPSPGTQSTPESDPPAYADHQEAPAYVNSDGDQLLLSAPTRTTGRERFNDWLAAQREIFEARFPNTRNHSEAEREEHFTQFLIARNEDAGMPQDSHLDTHPLAAVVAPEAVPTTEALTSRDRQFLNAIRNGDTEELHEMTRYEGVPINAHYTDRITPLHLAAMAGHSDTIQLLIMNGARLNATTNQGLTPLHAAVIAGKTQAVRLLIAAGANAAIVDRYERSPLLTALEQDDMDMMATLLGMNPG